MRVLNMQSTTFQGVYTSLNFNPTAKQDGMIKIIENKLMEDPVIFRKGKNFHDYLESKSQHFLLSKGKNNDEIMVELGPISDDGIIPEYNLGSYPENKLDSIVIQLKNVWQGIPSEKSRVLAMLIFSLAFLSMILLAGAKR